MNLIDVVRIVWLLAGIAALYFAARKLTKAVRDHQAHVRSGGNGSVLYAGRWRIRAAQYGVALAAVICIGASLSVIDWLIPGPAVLAIWTLLTLSIWPVLFAWSLFSDDRNHELLLQLISTSGSQERRKMDEHISAEDEPA